MMFKHRSDLLAEVLRQDKNLSAVQKRFAKQIDKLFRDVRARYEAMVLRPENFSDNDKLTIARATRMAGQIGAILNDAGMDDLLTDYVETFPRLTADALKYFALVDAATDFAGLSRESLTAYVQFSEEVLVTLVDQTLVAPLREGIFQATFGLQTRDMVVQNLLAKSDSLSPARAQLIVADSMAQYQRTVTAQKAEHVGLEVYLYQGPYDEITSDQCRFMLNFDEHDLPGAFYKDEISADLHENLRANPLIAGGHPRCRHRWTPIPLDAAKEMGFKE